MYADTAIDKVTTTVNSNISQVLTWVNQAQTTANSAIESIGVFSPPAINFKPPASPTLTLPAAPSLTVPSAGTIAVSPQQTTFSPTGTLSPPALSLPTAPAYQSADFPAQPPTYAPPNAPSAPSYQSLVGVPLPTFVPPSAPILSPVAPPSFISITDAPLIFPTLDGFDASSPIATIPSSVGNPSDHFTEFTPDFSSGIPAFDQDAQKKQVETLSAQVEREARLAKAKAGNEWAAKNFSLAPGPWVEQIVDIDQDSARQRRKIAAQVRDDSARLNLDLLKTSIDLENTRLGIAVDLWIEHLRELIDAEKLKVKAAVALFDTTVALFNASQKNKEVAVSAYVANLNATVQASQSLSQVARLSDAKMSENEARVECYAADVKLESSRNEIFAAQVQAASAQQKGYQAYVQGLRAQATVEAANVGAYRDSVRGYAASVEGASAAIGAAATYYQAAGSVAGVEEANARSSAVTASETAKVAAAQRTYSAAQHEVMQANLQAYRAAGESHVSFMHASAAKISAQAEIVSAQSTAYSTALRATSSYNQAVAHHSAAQQQCALTALEMATQVQALSATAQAETDKVNAGALAAKATAAAAVAHGAMSAVYASAESSASGTASRSARQSGTTNSTWGGSTQRTETAPV